MPETTKSESRTSPRRYSSGIEATPKTTDSKARIDGFIAGKAPVAVIFRRGPSAVTQQLLWNLKTDEVTPGEWIRASVYTRRCDVSPNGKYLIGFFSNYSPPRMAKAAKEFGLKEARETAAWTAISFVNSFRNLGLWFQGNTYFGGGQWLANAKVEVHHPNSFHQAIPAPADIITKRVVAREVGFVWFARLESRGWQRVKGAKRTLARPGVAMQWFKRSDNGRLLYESTRTDDAGDETWTLFDKDGNPVRKWETTPDKPMFIDFDHRGRVVYGENGCLYAWQNWPVEAPQLIADLNENVPPSSL